MEVENNKTQTINSAEKVEAYEYFTGGKDRQRRLNDFLSGKTTHLDLDYPLLEDDSKIKRIYNHNSIASWTGENYKTVTNEYELAQAALVLQAAAARRLLLNGDTEQLALAEDRLKTINAELFGLPDRQLVLSAKKAALRLVDKKQFTGKAAKIYQELKSGFIFKGEDGVEVNVKSFLNDEESANLDSALELPRISDEALKRLHEKITEEFSYAHKIVEDYWSDQIATRAEEDRLINSVDAKILFEKCISSYPGLVDGAHINVLYEENSTATSWSSEKNAVVVAGKRKPFKDVDEFFGVFVHEFGVHGRRWMNGKNSTIPELSKGVYTITDSGDVVDYLTFEEGLAATMQKAASNKGEKWDMASLGLYLVAGLADEERSDREIFEILNRIRALAKIKKDATEITEKLWADASKDTLTQVVRIFRGMPKATDSSQAAVYLKDMAYLSGKVKVIEYLNSMSKLPDDEWGQRYEKLFLGKIDNSEPTQESLVS